jgi:HK97 gp10 family phage protein
VSSISVTVKGTEQLATKFRRLQFAMRGDILVAAASVGAEVIKAESKNIVPVDTGNLRASITSEETSRSDTSASVAVGYGKQAPYGKYVELGTSRMAAQPFLRPPMTTHRDQAIRAVTDSLKRQIDRVAT